jgi:hypothetical protein
MQCRVVARQVPRRPGERRPDGGRASAWCVGIARRPGTGRFPLSSFVVEVLKIFEIYLHQLTPEAIIRMNIFVWAVRSQGLEPDAKSFCNIHELLYETKPWGKEQYHNNFGCYSFGSRSGSSCPVPTFRKRWPGD